TLRMKRRLNHAPLPQPLVTLGDEDAVTIPLSKHLHRLREATKLLCLDDEDFPNGLRVKEDVCGIGTEANANHVAVAALELGVIAQGVLLHLAKLRQPEVPIARTRRKCG